MPGKDNDSTKTNGTTTKEGESTTKDATKVDKSAGQNATEKSITSEKNDESSDDFWIAAIEDALSRAKDGFVRTRKALDEFYA